MIRYSGAILDSDWSGGVDFFYRTVVQAVIQIKGLNECYCFYGNHGDYHT